MVRRRRSGSRSNPQAGYMLLVVMLLVTLLLIALATELPRLSQQIKRDKEEELIRRGKEYATAIKKYYHKVGTYPVSLEQLENTNQLRFLRKRYKDPMTQDGEWKLIHVGEAQINIPAPAPGAGGPPSASPSPTGSPTPPGSASTGTGGLTRSANTGMGALQTTGIGSGSNQGGGPIIGVASNSKKTSIREYNGDTEYDRWLFVYDPKLEQAQPGPAGGIIIASPRSSSSPTGGPGQTPGPGQMPPQGFTPPAGSSPTPTAQVPR